jgi:hypothetical protein
MTTSTMITKAIKTTLLTAGACLAVASCASTQPYNPNHLSADRLSQVGEVCQTDMGFRASEPLTDNLWPGDPDASSSTNRYRGCIATLSNALTRVQTARTAKQAEKDCLSQGFVAGSSDLARCVLTAKEEPRSASETQLASLDPKPYLISTGRRFSGPVPPKVHKEQLACADVGIDPNDEEFASCVQGLKGVGWAPFLQDLYRND